jgi:hypothetical protein
MSRRPLIILALLLAACVPARQPEQLAFTPGPPVIVTDNTYQNAVFSARYPAGWRLITSAADAPLAVILVAPDEVSTVTLQLAPVEAAAADGVHLETRVLRFDGVTVYAAAQAPADQWPDFAPVFDRVLSSVMPTQP